MMSKLSYEDLERNVAALEDYILLLENVLDHEVDVEGGTFIKETAKIVAKFDYIENRIRDISRSIKLKRKKELTKEP
jgi:hypothetical protein